MNAFVKQSLKSTGLKMKKKFYDSTSSSTSSHLMLPNKDEEGAEAEAALITNLEQKARGQKLAFHRAQTMKRLASNRKFGTTWNGKVAESPLTPTEQLFNYADKVQEIFDETENETEDDYSSADSQVFRKDARNTQDFNDDETLPRYTTPLLKNGKSPSKQRRLPNLCKSLSSKLYKFSVEIIKNLMHFLLYSVMLLITPLMITSYYLFYHFNNPELEFLPTKVSLSWWLIFACRQIITFNLAKSVHFFVLKISLNRGIMFSKIAGPGITVLIIQSSGWPFLLCTWGILDMILLYGSGPFVQDWLYTFDIPMLSASSNPDFGLLRSHFYLRILLSVSFLGFVGGIKRTYVALVLGRRMHNHFKPQMDDLVIYMDLIAEVADLAFELNQPGFLESLNIFDAEDFLTLTKQRDKKATVLQKVIGKDSLEHKSSKNDTDDDADVSYEEEDDDCNKVPSKSPSQVELEGMSSNSDSANKKIDWNQLQKQVALDNSNRSNPMEVIEKSGNKQLDGGRREKNVTFEFQSETSTPIQSLLQRQSSSKIKIKDLLDRWTEPDNRYERGANNNPSIADIFRFNQVASLLEEPFPFGKSFGLADTRDHTIRSSMKVYKSLQKLSLLSDMSGEKIPFDIIGSLAYDDKGDIHDEKAKFLVRLFRPDNLNELSQLSFVQSTDFVYRKLRYLRASMTNSTRIDRVLENIFNVIFYFVASLIVMAILDLDPRAFLVTMSTLFLSVAFAIGPSIAKYIEGILFISRRPFDIGDRIAFCGAEVVAAPQGGDTWFVEDITFTTTTLRYAATNEVATLVNHSIANSRIVNHAKSSQALVTISLRLNLDSTTEQVESFKQSLTKYVANLPRVWSNLLIFRVQSVDFNNRYVEYMMRFTHVKTWQDLGPIVINKGELEKEIVRMAESHGICWQLSIPKMSVLLNQNKVEIPTLNASSSTGSRSNKK